MSVERVQVIDDGVPEARCTGYEDAVVDPRVTWHAGLELYGKAEIVFPRVDLLAPDNSCEHLGRAMPNTASGDVDESFIVRLQRVPRVYTGRAVGVDHLPVGAARKHLAAQGRSLKATPNYGNDAPLPGRTVPERHRWAKLDHEPPKPVESQRGMSTLSMSNLRASSRGLSNHSRLRLLHQP